MRILDVDAGANTSPTFLKVLLGARKLEIVDVDDQEEPELRVPITRRPCLIHRNEATSENLFLASGDKLAWLVGRGGQMTVAHLLPKSTRIGVAVKCQAKGANRITHLRPFFGPTVLRQTNPRISAPKERLGVRLYRIPPARWRAQARDRRNRKPWQPPGWTVSSQDPER